VVWLVIGSEVNGKEGNEREREVRRKWKGLGCELIEEIFESSIGIRL